MKQLWYYEECVEGSGKWDPYTWSTLEFELLTENCLQLQTFCRVRAHGKWEMKIIGFLAVSVFKGMCVKNTVVSLYLSYRVTWRLFSIGLTVNHELLSVLLFRAFFHCCEAHRSLGATILIARSTIDLMYWTSHSRCYLHSFLFSFAPIYSRRVEFSDACEDSGCQTMRWPRGPNEKLMVMARVPCACYADNK